MARRPVRESVRAFINANLSPEARARELARVARETVAGWVAEGRASPRFLRVVDGRPGALEESVRPGGAIEYYFAAVADAAEFAIAFLRARSPAATGKYRESFIVGINGRMVKAAAFNPASVPPGAEIIITNTQPYSRKVDVQLVGTRRIRFSVPAGLFDDAARAVKARFGNTVTARRVYTVDFAGRYVLRRRKRHGRRAGQKVDSPALVLKANG